LKTQATSQSAKDVTTSALTFGRLASNAEEETSTALRWMHQNKAKRFVQSVSVVREVAKSRQAGTFTQARSNAKNVSW
jgi:hypothetical protein